MVRGNANREVTVFPEDHSSPFYLHPSDNPGISLVPQQMNGCNYSSWSRAMVTALMAKNKLGFVNGDLQKPPIGDVLHDVWIRCNSMVVSWLRNSVSPTISSSLLYLDNAQLIWSDLRDRFSEGNIARFYQLRQQFMTLVQGNLDVNSYFTKLRSVWDEYKDLQPLEWCNCGTCRCGSAQRWNEHQQQEFSVQFLLGLNGSYSALRSNIMSMVPFPTISRIFSLIIQEERQRVINGGVVKPVTQSVSETPSSYANAAGLNRGRNKLFCSHCKKTNHTVDRCFSLYGFPQGYGRGNGAPPSTNPGHVNMVQSAENSTDNQSTSSTSSVSSASSVPPTGGTLSNEQCMQLLQFLNTQMTMKPSDSSSSHGNNPSVSHINSNIAGDFHGFSDWDG